jgi:adenylate cyclase
LLLEFASIVDAVRCVLAVQTAVMAHMAPLPADQRIAFRVGVNVGDIIIDGDDIFGDGVNIAARIEGIAEPDGICLSDDAWRQVRGKVDASFDKIGAQPLKNIAQPVEVWRWVPTKAAQPQASVLALPDKPSIAVLPFQNMSGDPEQEYFADGMTEDILTALSRFQNLFVIARNSSFTYKGRSVDIKRVGKELGVRYVLEGSVRAAANRVRITAQLIDATSGHHVCADRYDRALTDIFAVQDEVTAQIVAAIDFEVRAVEAQRPGGAASEGLEAWARYHQAFPLLFRLTEEENRKAANLFDALRASDDKDAFCHFALGRALLLAGDRNLALAPIERAVARNPNSALAHLFRGVTLIGLDRDMEALADIDLAIRLSPRDQGLWSFYFWQSRCHRNLGDLDAAVRSFRQAIGERPDLWFLHLDLGTTLANANRLDEAKAAVTKARELKPDLTLDSVAYLYWLFLSPRRVEVNQRLVACLVVVILF